MGKDRWVMINDLPTHGFLWKKEKDFTHEKVDELVKKGKRVYLLEVDVEYPKELHENHNELPFLAERMKIGREEKLVPNLKNKKGYVVHIKELDQALKHGLKLEKVHRVIEFRQSKWMKVYNMLNTSLRKDAKNEFEKDFFKLMNNSVFGKTMENIRNHKDMKLVTSDKKYLKYVMKPNLDGHPFSKHLFSVEMGKTEIKINKPVYLGQATLDLSKTLMYEFHYDYMRPKQGSKVNLCYMDTNSLVYEIETEDFYRDLAKDVKKRFDTSGYSKDDNRPLPIGENKKVIGLIKDELGEKIMTEFLALRAKMYAYRKIDKEVEETRCKGTKKCVVLEGLAFEDYKACLFDGKMMYREQMLFENKKHEVYTVNKYKIALSRDDDKRLVQADGITTLTRGYVAVSA